MSVSGAWGKNEQAVTANSTTTVESSNGAPIGTYRWVKKGKTGSNPTNSANAHFGNTSAGSRASVDSAMFANITMSAFINNMAVGVFGVSSVQQQIVDGQLLDGQLSLPGSGYFVNAAVTITAPAGSGGTVNAQSNSLGRISNLNIQANGSGYKKPVTIAVAAPSAQSFNANTSLYSAQTINANTSLYDLVSFNGQTGVTANGAITTNNQPFSVNDPVLYFTGASNIVPTGLTNNVVYYVKAANLTAVYLSATPGGAVITLTAVGSSQVGEFLERQNFVYTTAANPFGNGTVLTYTVAAGNTVIVPLAANGTYYVINANSIGFALSNTYNGAVINLTPGVTETGHTLTRYNFITLTQNPSVYQNGDNVQYVVATGNTAIVPLANAAYYIVTAANTTGFSLAGNSAQYQTGQFITLTPGKSETGHTVQGRTATGNVTIGGAVPAGVTMAGWHLRREGSGGRAGRVHYECLVAMHSLGAQTAQYGTPAVVATANGIANAVIPSAN